MGDSPHIRAPRVLVVDDNEMIVRVALRALAQAGFHAEPYDRASGLVEKVLAVRPDVVVLDVSLGNVDATLLVPELLARTAPRPLHVVLFSGMDEIELQNKARSCGAHGVVAKNGSLRLLVEVVASAIPVRASSRPVSSTLEPSRAPRPR